jgi:hypothetical protein
MNKEDRARYALRKLINTRKIEINMINDLGLTFNQYIEFTKLCDKEVSHIIEAIKTHFLMHAA